jgi:sugar/nucleoside kinase (ribokinase family)
VELAKRHQVAISLDTGLEPALIDPDGLRRLLNDVYVCIAGPKETKQLFHITDPQKAAEHLLSLGVKLAAIKLGEKGCYMASRQGECFCPAFEIESVDTTGAGDSFTAGLLFGWLRDWDLQTCALLGSALGALATTVHGAGLGLAGKDALLKFLNDRMDTQGWQGEIEHLIRLLE